jgi:hypothetical protein
METSSAAYTLNVLQAPSLFFSGLSSGKPKSTPKKRNMVFSYAHYVESVFVPSSLIFLDSLSICLQYRLGFVVTHMHSCFSGGGVLIILSISMIVLVFVLFLMLSNRLFD